MAPDCLRMCREAQPNRIWKLSPALGPRQAASNCRNSVRRQRARLTVSGVTSPVGHSSWPRGQARTFSPCLETKGLELVPPGPCECGCHENGGCNSRCLLLFSRHEARKAARFPSIIHRELAELLVAGSALRVGASLSENGMTWKVPCCGVVLPVGHFIIRLAAP